MALQGRLAQGRSLGIRSGSLPCPPQLGVRCRRCVQPGRKQALHVCAGLKTEGERRKKLRQKQKEEKSPSKPLDYIKDLPLILGDLVMLVATQSSSERIPMFSASEDGGGFSPDFLWLTGVTAACWLVSATVLGDYKGERPESDDWYQNLLGPVYIAVVEATLTWGLSAVSSAAIFSYLLSVNLLSAGPLLTDIRTEDTSPQLEVAIAVLITMSCWRGIAWFLRCR